jgi:hypothetical protein
MTTTPVVAPHRPSGSISSSDAPSATRRFAELLLAAGVFAVALLAYNANGREIRTYDSRPTALAARELLSAGTLALDRDVAETPEYATRWGFILARDGHYRSVYSPVPALVAGALAWPVIRTGLIEVDAPLAPQVIAKLAASILVALAAALAYLTARRHLSRRLAILVALGVGLGTGYWSSASQTLWQSETAVFGLAAAVLLLSRNAEGSGLRSAAMAGAALALALTARPQIAPAVAVLLCGTAWRLKPRSAVLVFAIVGAAAGALAMVNMRWFGHPLGALPLLSSANADIHQTGRSFVLHADGYLGLLISPSRGLLVFSPVVLVALAGTRAAIRRGASHVELWCLLAAVAQFLVYGSYSVWWGGHTFGPRYLIDVLPMLVPLGALALARPRSFVWNDLAAVALGWSILVAATGAFCYPNDAWNTSPADVDRDHARLWSVSDNQILRCWKAGVSPQTFTLITRDAFRRPKPDNVRSSESLR